MKPIYTVLILALCTVALTGCFKITSPDSNLKLQQDAKGEMYLSKVIDVKVPVSFKALVKGSIYETGELMSVFGTCLNADDGPVFGSYAEFSAWYPNGTQFLFSDNMTQIQTSYFVWRGNMSAVPGTYLTEMRCRTIFDPNMTALAYGEWQNPYWVRRIALLNDSIHGLNASLANLSFNTTVDLSNITGQLNQINYTLNSVQTNLGEVNTTVSNINMTINNVSVTMNQSFAITWQQLNYTNYLINQTVQQLNQSIYYVAAVANASVDRNDSYLAQLIRNLSLTINPNNTGIVLAHTDEPEYPVYFRVWNIQVTALSPSGKKVAFPDSKCYINTTLTTTQTLMTADGEKYKYAERITSTAPFDWTVSCFYS
jgi:hypothetical protein